MDGSGSKPRLAGFLHIENGPPSVNDMAGKGGLSGVSVCADALLIPAMHAPQKSVVTTIIAPSSTLHFCHRRPNATKCFAPALTSILLESALKYCFIISKILTLFGFLACPLVIAFLRTVHRSSAVSFRCCSRPFEQIALGLTLVIT